MSKDLSRELVGWTLQLVRRAEQALGDLSVARTAEVSFIRHPRQRDADDLLSDVSARAGSSGYVTADVRVLSDRAFDTFAALVEAVLRAARPPGGPAAKRGVPALLDAFAAEHRDRALEVLDARMNEAGLAGDLATLARAYVAAGAPSRAYAAHIEAWLSGVETARTQLRWDPKARARTRADEFQPAPATDALSPRTAKRALADLTRLVRILGYKGTLVTLQDADAVAHLPPERRQAAYTVLRELIDNADGGRGLDSALVLLAASTSFFVGPRSLSTLRPLATRIDGISDEPDALAPPHRPLVELPTWAASARNPLPALRAVSPGHAGPLRALIRGARGLPPLDATPAMSVGHAALDRSIDALFEHSRDSGSVFALLVGDYGTGKTHFLSHLSARALGERRPVLRLSIERLDADAGQPERHLARVLEHTSLPGVTGPRGALDRLLMWTRSADGLRQLTAELRALAASPGDEAGLAAARALAFAEEAPSPAAALETFLRATDLATRVASPETRRDAYGRLLLWLSLLERADGLLGPVLLVDEAENLYRGGVEKEARRTALRSLSFYCGGALPRACVVLAITPDALVELTAEAPVLLDDTLTQDNLVLEDASMLCARLRRTPPIRVPELSAPERADLLEKIRATHNAVRGPVSDAEWGAFAQHLAGQPLTPREIVRRAIDRLERRWWAG